ncbi:alpha/beta fold hydrolase [Aneurinibacillus sp. Ricciae_BoGa-3]|uniref:alpha/beta hydrolase family protein n=1 Tax=Aneurinibacillus sp. Ricciae_BoGa-3 TaxID=3022697 RepID=UPI00234230BE|nr:alpha/beta fold hydrolase [Aneurinibacillus sp. Ricciae_BoGa-3]WCK54125.1 alpha/beta fold hydrolase [Aneurinibacillus sp. Ricciae_BoGa-3]
MKQSFQLVRKEGLTIRGDVYLEETEPYRKPVIIICHGFKGFKDWAMFPVAGTYFARHGFIAITFNFSGNGIGEDLHNFTELEKFGRNTYQQELSDLDFLIQMLKEGRLPFAEHTDTSRIGLVGHSKGGGDAILYATSYPENIRATVTWNGVAHVDVFGPEIRKQVEENQVGYVVNSRTGQKMPIEKMVLQDIDINARQYDLLSRVAEMEQPLLIIQGRDDSEKLVRGAESLKQHARNALLHWIEGAGHTFNMVHPSKGYTPQMLEALDVTAGFFSDHL